MWPFRFRTPETNWFVPWNEPWYFVFVFVFLRRPPVYPNVFVTVLVVVVVMEGVFGSGPFQPQPRALAVEPIKKGVAW